MSTVCPAVTWAYSNSICQAGTVPIGLYAGCLQINDRPNRSRRCLDEAPCLWLWRHPSGRRGRIFGVCPAELLVRGPVDFVAELESRNVGPDTFDDSRELGTESQRQGLELHLTLTDEGVPMTHPCRLDADQQLPSAGCRLRHVLV